MNTPTTRKDSAIAELARRRHNRGVKSKGAACKGCGHPEHGDGTGRIEAESEAMFKIGGPDLKAIAAGAPAERRVFDGIEDMAPRDAARVLADFEV